MSCPSQISAEDMCPPYIFCVWNSLLLFTSYQSVTFYIRDITDKATEFVLLLTYCTTVFMGCSVQQFSVVVWCDCSGYPGWFEWFSV